MYTQQCIDTIPVLFLTFCRSLLNLSSSICFILPGSIIGLIQQSCYLLVACACACCLMLASSSLVMPSLHPLLPQSLFSGNRQTKPQTILLLSNNFFCSWPCQASSGHFTWLPDPLHLTPALSLQAALSPLTAHLFSCCVFFFIVHIFTWAYLLEPHIATV